MVSAAMKDELLTQLDQLPVELQQRVVAFASALALANPKGTPGRELLHFAGTMDEDSAREMIEAIEQGCEQT
ncbi:MAG: hypothetical protein JNK60_17110 [Acidobacteria bacterium]|nr:hypothetical protein [Acidobacteriota bacterium]